MLNLKSPYLLKIKSLPNIVINKNEENDYKINILYFYK